MLVHPSRLRRENRVRIVKGEGGSPSFPCSSFFRLPEDDVAGVMEEEEEEEDVASSDVAQDDLSLRRRLCLRQERRMASYDASKRPGAKWEEDAKKKQGNKERPQ